MTSSDLKSRNLERVPLEEEFLAASLFNDEITAGDLYTSAIVHNVTFTKSLSRRRTLRRMGILTYLLTQPLNVEEARLKVELKRYQFSSEVALVYHSFTMLAQCLPIHEPKKQGNREERKEERGA